MNPLLNCNLDTTTQYRVQTDLKVKGTHLGTATNFYLRFFSYFLESYGFVGVGRPL
jgi:hypothetical protein